MTGSRPLVIEVQAICPKTSFSFPKKLSIGYDVNRLFILVAVLEKSLGMPFSDRDVYVNVTGGIKVGEPAHRPRHRRVDPFEPATTRAGERPRSSAR